MTRNRNGLIQLLAAASLAAAPLLAEDIEAWKPVFKDAPVPEDQVKKVADALPEKPIVKPKATRKVLVFSATSGFRHKSIPVGNLALECMGESTGAYEATVSNDPAHFEPKALKQFDAVIMLSPTQDFFMPNRKARKQFTDEQWKALQDRHNRLVDNLIDYVEQGGGLVGIHAATDACYKHKAYGDAMGGYFAGHPWCAGHNVTIVVEDPTHAVIKPVFEGMSDFRIQDEIYQFKDEPYSRERLRVLLHLDPARSDPPRGKPRRTDNDYAVCWVQSVGKGRVFYSSLGHNSHIYWNPLMLKHYLAGIQFAMGDLDADTTPSAKLKMPHVAKP